MMKRKWLKKVGVCALIMTMLPWNPIGTINIDNLGKVHIGGASTQAVKAAVESFYDAFAPDEEWVDSYSLTEDEKKVYDHIVDKIKEQISSVDASEDYAIEIDYTTCFENPIENETELKNTLKKALYAVRCMHPEYFWYKEDKVLIEDGKIQVIVAKKFASKVIRTSTENELKSLVSEFKKKVTEDSTDYIKIKAVHDYIIDSADKYDKNAQNANNIVGILIDGQGGSISYAKATQFLLNCLELRNMYVSANNETTAWNKVLITNSISDIYWVNVDTCLDDLQAGYYSKAADARYQGISYRYFCRDDEQFSHSSADGYKADITAHSCTRDENYFYNQNEYFYIQDLNKINSFMTYFVDHQDEFKPEDGHYYIRLGAVKTFDLRKEKNAFKKGNLVCEEILEGPDGDYIFQFKDTRSFVIYNATEEDLGDLYISRANKDLGSDFIWEKNTDYTIPITEPTFYVQTKTGGTEYKIANISYQINGGTTKYLSLGDCVKSVEGETNLYQCKLPFTPDENSTVKIKVSYTEKKIVKLEYDEASYSAVYGTPVSVTVTVKSADGSGSKPSGKVKFYKDEVKEDNLIATTQLNDGKATMVTNSVQTGPKLSAGNHNLYAVYEGNSTYSTQTAANVVSIEKATLQLSVNDSERQYGQENNLTYTFEGFQYGQDEQDFTENVTDLFEVTTTATKSSVCRNDYPIQATVKAEAANYKIQLIRARGTLTINPATPDLMLTTDKSSIAVGDTLHLTLTVKNPHDATLTANLPTADKAHLYLGTTKVGDFKQSAQVGVYTYDYVVDGSVTTLDFKATTEQDNGRNYLTGTSAVKEVAVANNQFVVTFDNMGYGNALSPQIVQRGEKLTYTALTDDTDQFAFVGWFKGTKLPNGSVDYKEKWNFDQDTVTNSITLYAKWEPMVYEDITDVKVVEYAGGNYDGRVHEAATITGLKAGDEVSYELNTVGYDQMPSVKNAGEYSLVIKVQRKKHNPLTITRSITILPVVPAITLANHTATYNGRTIVMPSAVVTGVNGEEVSATNVQYTYYKDVACTKLTSTTEDGAVSEGGAPKYAGIYYVTALYRASGNYKDVGIAPQDAATLTINKETLAAGLIHNVAAEIPTALVKSYEVDLKGLIPTNIDFGKVSFELGNVPTNPIIDGTPTIENGTLRYKTVSAPEGKSVAIEIRVISQNYNPVTFQYIINTKNRTQVRIKGSITTPDKTYDSEPYQYKGGYIVVNAGTDAELDLTLEEYYTGKTITNEDYASATAPSVAGQYTLTLKVPDSNTEYAGSASYDFNITKADLVITAESRSIGLGTDTGSFTFSATGLGICDSILEVKFTCSYVKNDATHGVSGNYDIIPKEATITNVENYNVIYKKGTLYVKGLHTIRFNAGISDDANPAPVQAAEGNKVILPSVTVRRDGYIFMGWSDGTDTYPANAEYNMVDNDVVFTAVWKVEKALTKITVDYTGEKRLAIGTEIPITSIKVTAHYTDGAVETVTDFTLSSQTVTVEGNNVIEVSYRTVSMNFLIEGYKNDVKSIKATYKDSVMAGQKLDETKLVVEATYEDGTTKQITSGYTIEEYNITVGKNNLTIEYQNKTTTIEVTGIPLEGMAVLTFDTQGGLPVNNAVVQIGSKFTPPTAYRVGYVFLGWFTKPGGQGTEFTGNTVVSGTSTFYAHWREASGNADRLYATYLGELHAGELYESDFLVVGVFANGNRAQVEGFSITPNKLSVGNNKITITYDKAQTIVSLFVPDRPSKLSVRTNEKFYHSGYTLTYNDLTVVATMADGTTKELKEYYLTGNTLRLGENRVTVSYQGTEQSITVVGHQGYTITFNSVGGSTIKPMEVIAGREIGALPTPTRKKYEFEGWYLDVNYNKKCTSTNKLSGNVILYAKWKELKPYKISDKYINVKSLGQDSVSIIGAEGVQWISDDLNIASIDRDGIITGINKGTTVITGITEDGYELTCLVTVGNEVKKIEVPKAKVKLKANKKYNLKAKVTPKKAVTKKLVYSTTDPYVATVNSKGVVRANGEGTCYIIIKTTDSSNLTKKIKITVEE